MSKQSWRGSTLLNPEPPVLVSCGGLDKPNLITIGWTGTICTQPSMVSISVRPERYSHQLIKRERTVRHQPAHRGTGASRWTGAASRAAGTSISSRPAACTPPPASVLTDCPILAESPVNLECRVTQRHPAGQPRPLPRRSRRPATWTRACWTKMASSASTRPGSSSTATANIWRWAKSWAPSATASGRKKHGGNNFPVLDNSRKTNYTKNRKGTATSG